MELQSHNAEIARLQKTIATEIGKDKFEIPEVIEEKIINNEEEFPKNLMKYMTILIQKMKLVVKRKIYMKKL